MFSRLDFEIWRKTEWAPYNLSKFSEQRATTASTDLSNPRITGYPKRAGRFVLTGILLHENCLKPCGLPCGALFSIQRSLICLCSNRFIMNLNPPCGDISCKEYRNSTTDFFLHAVSVFPTCCALCVATHLGKYCHRMKCCKAFTECLSNTIQKMETAQLYKIRAI